MSKSEQLSYRKEQLLYRMAQLASRMAQLLPQGIVHQDGETAMFPEELLAKGLFLLASFFQMV